MPFEMSFEKTKKPPKNKTKKQKQIQFSPENITCADFTYH